MSAGREQLRSQLGRVGRLVSDSYYRATARRPSPSAPHVLVAPPLPANRGDEAMLVAALAEYARLGVKRLIVIETGPTRYEPPALPPSMAVEFRRDLWLYFSSTATWSEERELKRLLTGAASVTFIGADVLDGTYGEVRALQTIRLAAFVASTPVPTQIVGFSVSDALLPDVAAEFRRSSPPLRLCGRDPRSVARLHAAGARDVHATADIAFLLEATPMARPAARARGAATLGVCLHVGWTGNDQDAGPLTELAGILNTVTAARQLDVLLISHHPRDYEVLEPLSRHLQRATLIPETRTAAETKWLAGQCSHMLTSRMHVAIAALGMGVPVSCFASRGKFHGLIDHFGLNADSVCLNDAARTPAPRLEAWLDMRLAAGPAEATVIGDRLEAVRSLSRLNFSGIRAVPA